MTVALAHRFKPDNLPALGYEILHSLHGPGFAILALIVLWYLRRIHFEGNNYLTAGVITIGIGVLSEIAQIPGARDAQVSDIVVDGLAAGGALGLSASLDSRVRRSVSVWSRLALPLAATISLTITCAPTVWYSNALAQQTRQFPILLTFENEWEAATFGRMTEGQLELITPPINWPFASSGIARSAEAGRYGIFLSHHPLPNWSEYSRISFVVASVEREFDLYFCIRDQEPNENEARARFCQSISIDNVPQRVSFDFKVIQASVESRPLNFEKIDAIIFSASDPGNNQAILIDDIRLEK